MSDWHIKNNALRVVRILRIKPENPYVKTITFKDELSSSADPGQFIMVWIPGVDEIPLSISSVHPDGSVSVTVAEVGDATKALNSMGVNDLIGVRGPFGNKFEIYGKRALIIGGGTGMAPLLMLTNRVLKMGVGATVIEGAETKNKIVFLEELTSLPKLHNKSIKVFFTTEDGSYGIKGLITDLVEEMLHREKFDVVYACGPEGMIRKIYEITEQYSVDMQASLERYIRCAIGICGSCVIGGYRVCRDGPVFSEAQMRKMKNYLGKVRYNERGERIQI
ncbi:dihydroorotate dehydrogenase electron transfer subunit [Candidatus Bathyarchaeota archaeon]|nr:dihydroorotate dehydrogenase electron transfer subunit [Candidatus Bathyarchaeota archaeon]